jgi:gliding motility-associated lipoprotein GldD
MIELRNKSQESTPGHLKSLFWLLLSCIVIFASCGDDDDEIMAPRPRAYYRLTFPEKQYVKYDSACPFTFQMPVYSKIENDKNYLAEPCWLNMQFPSFNGTLHLTYKAVTGKDKIESYIEDSYTLSSKHHVKASGIKEQLVLRDSSNVYGLIYDIEGNTATSFQFFLTDSTHHFIHGALYFNAVPNTDSIAPVISFLKKDIYTMINTLEWKE